MSTQVSPPSSREQTLGARRWGEALADPQLQDLPFKIETNARGQLVLSPHKHDHSFAQYRIGRLIETHLENPDPSTGRIGMEFAVVTADGVKVPDVVWISAGRVADIPGDAEASPVAPEICVEVLSASNTELEMKEKRALLFERGAREVWLAHIDGTVRFFEPEGEREQSKCAPAFPRQIDL
jgi:Uma2 family endonuclease